MNKFIKNLLILSTIFTFTSNSTNAFKFSQPFQSNKKHTLYLNIKNFMNRSITVNEKELKPKGIFKDSVSWIGEEICLKKFSKKWVVATIDNNTLILAKITLMGAKNSNKENNQSVVLKVKDFKGHVYYYANAQEALLDGKRTLVKNGKTVYLDGLLMLDGGVGIEIKNDKSLSIPSAQTIKK